MERKLVKQGRNALTVTLPSAWLKSRGLNAGDTVNLDIRNHEVRVKVGHISAFSEIEVDVKNEEKSIIWHKIIGAYIEGYDRIIITHNSPEVMQTLGTSLYGMIVERHTDTITVIKSLITVPENTLDVLMRRAAHMLVHQSVLLEQVADGKLKVEQLKKQEYILDSNIYYCQRFLNKYEDHQHSYRFFLLLENIEMAADQIARMAKVIKGKKALASSIKQITEIYTKYMFMKDLKKLGTELRKFRNTLKTRSFIDGLAYSYVEILYNDIGYLVEK